MLEAHCAAATPRLSPRSPRATPRSTSARPRSRSGSSACSRACSRWRAICAACSRASWWRWSWSATGDHVKRIAKQLTKIPGTLPAEVSSRLLWFGNQARALLQRALDAYARADATQANLAWADDVELDRMYHGFLSDLLARMRENGAWVDIGVRLVGIAKSMERIGDHATNIAEEARFVALGEITAARRGTL